MILATVNVRLRGRQLALVVAAVLVLVAVVAPGARATFRGHGTTIAWAYAAYDPSFHVSPDYGIRTVSSHGGRATTVVSCNSSTSTTVPACPQYAHVSYSPNGEQLAWAMTDLTGNSQIVLANASGVSPTTIAHPGENDFEPSFSPSSNRLVYVRNLGDGSPEQIVTSDLSGANVHVVTNLSSVDRYVGVDPAWSPDSRHILYTDRHAVWIVGSGGRRAHRLIARAERADWSPSGRQIVYTSYPYGFIHLARADGRGRRRLHISVPGGAQSPNFADYAVFSPDGRSIAFAGANAGGDPTVFVVSAHGGRARVIDSYYTGDEGAVSGDGYGTVGLSWQP